MEIKFNDSETNGFQVVLVLLVFLVVGGFLVRGCQTAHPDTCEKMMVPQ